MSASTTPELLAEVVLRDPGVDPNTPPLAITLWKPFRDERGGWRCPIEVSGMRGDRTDFPWFEVIGETPADAVSNALAAAGQFLAKFAIHLQIETLPLADGTVIPTGKYFASIK